MKGIVKAIGLLAILIPGTLLASCAHMSVVADKSGNPLDLKISTMEKIELNGTSQWIYHAGTDLKNPVLLWLDGGPGGSELGWVRKYLGPLHEHFTVICWDQRGTGKSAGAVKNYSTLRVEDYVQDVIALSSFLKERYGQEKIYLAGHSWGSIIGLKAAAARPDLYAAYIGIGQQINGPENDRIGWEMVHSGALAAGKTKVAHRLEKNGPPPYPDGERYFYLLSRLYEYSPRAPSQWRFNSMDMFRAPEHTLLDRLRILTGLMAGVKKVYPHVGYLDFEAEVHSLKCPLFIINGRYDYTCVATITERWFLNVEAPFKELIWFEDSGHTPCFTESEKFVQFMVQRVLAETQNL